MHFQPIELVLLDIPPMLEVLEGVVLELMDCSMPLLHRIIHYALNAVLVKKND